MLPDVSRAAAAYHGLGESILMHDADCYVLAPDRSSRAALAFLRSFAHGATPAWHPDDPADVIGAPPASSVSQLTEFLERNVSADYRLYFNRCSNGSTFTAILAYCSDGCAIFGLSSEAESANETLLALEQYVGSEGYWGGEEAPAGSRDEFVKRRALGRQPT